MDIDIVTTDPHEIDIEEVIKALDKAGYYVATVRVYDRNGRLDSAIGTRKDPGYDPKDYPNECDWCGTPINEATFDPTGSRRCDDTDPEHRWHHASVTLTEVTETRKDHDS